MREQIEKSKMSFFYLCTMDEVLTGEGIFYWKGLNIKNVALVLLE